MLRTETEWTGVPGAPYYTVMHFEGAGATQAGAAAGATRALWDAIKASIRNDMTARVLPEVSEVNVATGEVEATYINTLPPVVMTGSGARQPLVVQGLVRLRTGAYVGGREIRGKVFLPGTTDANDTDGVPSTAYQTAMNTAFQNLVSSSLAATVPLLVWSPTKGQAAQVTQVSTWAQWAILRSRRD